MIIGVKVIPNSRTNRVVEEGDGLKVYVVSPPAEGKANKELVQTLARYYVVRKSRVKMLKGEKSRSKLIEIEGY